MSKQKIEVPRATLDIFKYEKDGVTYYEFDATECQPPEPMVNTILCLALLKEDSQRLVVTFFHEPTPLFERIGDKFSYEAEELENGDYRVVFKK